MLGPDYLLALSEGAEALASDLHTEIIRRVVRRIVIRLQRGDTYILTPLDKWQLEVLAESGELLEDIQTEISRMTPYQRDEIARVFREAGIESLRYDHAVYEAAGLSPAPLTQSPYLVRLLERGYAATWGEWENYTRTTAQSAQQTFIRECDRAYNLVTTGTLSYSRACREAVERVAGAGISVVYPSGHRDTIETATMRAVRTGVAQSCAEITLARMDEMEWDIVLTSSHLGARTGDGGENFTNHEWWQGKFYSRSGRDPRFPPFSVCGFGNIQGIDGINCRHSFGPGDGKNNPFRHYDSDENKKAYELSQRQRALERRIRKTKREVMGLKEAVDNADDLTRPELEAAYQKKAELLQRQNKAYNDFCAENDLKRVDERLAVAGWNRKQAASATAAARKELDKYTGYRYNTDGTIKVTDDWTRREHVSLPKTYKPFAVVDTVSRKGRQRDRTIYDENAVMAFQVHGGNHGQPKQHPYGVKGEHVHEVTWIEGQTRAERLTREAQGEELVWHRDILRGDSDDS